MSLLGVRTSCLCIHMQTGNSVNSTTQKFDFPCRVIPIFNTDTNECEHNNGGCEGTCHNEIGTGFHCACADNQILKDGFRCEDCKCSLKDRVVYYFL